jgi:hypothetical protein
MKVGHCDVEKITIFQTSTKTHLTQLLVQINTDTPTKHTTIELILPGCVFLQKIPQLVGQDRVLDAHVRCRFSGPRNKILAIIFLRQSRTGPRKQWRNCALPGIMQYEREQPSGEPVGMLDQIGFDSTWIQRKRQDAIFGKMMRHPGCENDISLST